MPRSVTICVISTTKRQCATGPCNLGPSSISQKLKTMHGSQLQLKRLCQRKEMYEKAEATLQTARILLMGPNTENFDDIVNDTSGLTAICAYIASTELGNGDIPEEIARLSSCLAPGVFKSRVNIVKSTLVAAAEAEAEEAASQLLTYEDLIKQHRFIRGDFMLSCMKEAESTIIQCRHLWGGLKVHNNTIIVVIFYWVCIILKLHGSVRHRALERFHSISAEDFDKVLDIITSSCGLVAKDIEQKVTKLRAASCSKSTRLPSPSMSTAPSPSKSILIPLSKPSKLSPEPSSDSVLKPVSKPALKSASPTESSPTQTATRKRAVAWDPSLEDVSESDGASNDGFGPDIPLKKRRRLSSSSIYTPRPDGNTPQQQVISDLTTTEGSSIEVSRSTSPSASSSRLEPIEASRAPEEDKDNTPPIVREVGVNADAGPSQTSRHTPSSLPTQPSSNRHQTVQVPVPPTPALDNQDRLELEGHEGEGEGNGDEIQRLAAELEDLVAKRKERLEELKERIKAEKKKIARLDTLLSSAGQ